MSIHVAITRRVRPGFEADFQRELRDFFRESFAHGSVLGASMISPMEGGDSREFGILRTFEDEAQRDLFYSSPMFEAWEKRARSLTEGESHFRQLHGLEAFFRSAEKLVPPARWKMALATSLGVYPTSLLLGETVGRLTVAWPIPARAALFAILMVTLLTWVVMPQVTRVLRFWLHPNKQTKQ